MLVVSPASHAHQIRNAATKLNVPLPEPFTAALATAERVTQESAQYDAAVSELNARAAELLAAGKSPEDDATIKRLTTRRVLSQSGIRIAGADHANGLVLQAIRDCADRILSEWADALAPDIDALHRAGEALNIEDLNSADTLAIERSGKLALLGAALGAQARVTAACSGLRVIIAATGLSIRREHLPLTLSDATLTQVDAINQAAHPGAPSAWTVVRCGAALSLPTLTELKARVADYDQAHTERQARFEESRRPDGFDTQRRREAIV